MNRPGRSPVVKLANRVLRRMVSLRRPHGSPEELSIAPYLQSLAKAAGCDPWTDGAGNLHCDMRKWDSHRSLFVGHVDTVHRTGGQNQVREDAKGLYAVDTCLGADDAAGVAILVAMLSARVPGYYIFTRGEECGGIGAKYLADHHAELLVQFDRAIAFDRRGTADVITHQYSGRCASDAFADGLSDALNQAGLLYMPCDGGVYTDTAEFAHLIPECTNISTGYYCEHSKEEWLDLSHWSQLLDAALGIDWDALPTERDVDGDGWDDDFNTLPSLSGKHGRSINDYPPCLYPGDKDIEAAVRAAEGGFLGDLIQMLGARISPDNPSSASRQMDRRALGPDELLYACRQYNDWDMVLEYLAGEAFVYF